MPGPTPKHNITGDFAVNGVSVPGGQYLPSDHGLLAWTYDPATATSGSNTTSGTLYLAQLNLRTPQTVSKLGIGLSSAAAGVTANQNFLGLYDSSGAKVAATAAGGIDSALTSSGVLLASLSASYVAPAGLYWLAFLNNATTPAQVARTSTFASTPNVNLSASTYRFAVNGTGLTALPSTITPASNSLTNLITMWGCAA
jgi:hypothetical protein